MPFDLLTLYYLAIGTLLSSAALTLWECQAQHTRTRSMVILAAGYCTLAMGCALAIVRGQFPGATGAALSNMTMVSGYLMIMNGVASLNGDRHHRLTIGILAGCLAMWAIAGEAWQVEVWTYVSAMPIALVSALTVWTVARNQSLSPLRASRVVMTLAAAHAVFYAGRALALPLLAARFGNVAVEAASTVTMYEGVLYSVGLPMAILALIRDEAQSHLLQASQTDYLTGLGNRRWFFEKSERLIGGTDAEDTHFSLLAFDLDHFKAINDRHGHATGDQVLRHFARVARREAGRDAIVARMGGEEFVAILPAHDKCQAAAVGEAVARAFARIGVHDPDGATVKATVSIGLAQFGVDGTALGDLLSAADRALYLAKKGGRNRIEFAPPLECAAA